MLVHLDLIVLQDAVIICKGFAVQADGAGAPPPAVGHTRYAPWGMWIPILSQKT